MCWKTFFYSIYFFCQKYLTAHPARNLTGKIRQLGFAIGPEVNQCTCAGAFFFTALVMPAIQPHPDVVARHNGQTPRMPLRMRGGCHVLVGMLLASYV
jgi:hypothetical protein